MTDTRETKVSRVDAIGVLRDIVTEYVDGRMVSPPEERVRPECWIEFHPYLKDDQRQVIQENKILIITPISEKFWRWHIIEKHIEKHIERYETYLPSSQIPESYTFKVSDAKAALRMIISYLHSTGSIKEAARLKIPMPITDDMSVDLFYCNEVVEDCVDFEVSWEDIDEGILNVNELKEKFNTIIDVLESNNLTTPIFTKGPKVPVPELCPSIP